MCYSCLDPFNPLINHPVISAGVSTCLGSCVHDFPHIASLYVKNGSCDSWGWIVARLKSGLLELSFLAPLFHPKHFIFLLCLVYFHPSLFSSFRHQGCAPRICKTFLPMKGGMKRRLYKTCRNKCTSVTSCILFPSIRIVVVHGRASVSQTFALYLHVSFYFCQAYSGLVVIFSIWWKTFRSPVGAFLLHLVQFLQT